MKKYIVIAVALFTQVALAEVPQGLGQVSPVSGESHCNSSYYQGCGACKLKCLQIYQSETREAKDTNKDVQTDNQKRSKSSAVSR